jgi:hypothetical protein
MNEFIRLFEKSVIISGLLALMLVATGCYLWASGRILLRCEAVCRSA